MEITKVYPLDAVFDNPDSVPEDVNTPYTVESILYILLYSVHILICWLV